MKGKTGPVGFEKDVESWSLIGEKQQDTAYVTNEIDEDEFAKAKEGELKSWTQVMSMKESLIVVRRQLRHDGFLRESPTEN